MKAIHVLLALAGAASCSHAAVLDEGLLRGYVARFNAGDEELYSNAVPNSAAADFLAANAPLFECPDKDVERTYHFRWWTFRKHLRKTPSGWVVTEFLPSVGWAGKENTISCPMGHHQSEGRWLRDGRFVADYTRFMVTEGRTHEKGAYACWPATGLLKWRDVTGDAAAVKALLPDLVRNYEGMEFSLGGDGSRYGRGKGLVVLRDGSLTETAYDLRLLSAGEMKRPHILHP